MRYAVQTMGDPYGQARVRASNSSGSKDLVIFPPIGWGATAAPVEQSTCSKIADSQAEVKVRAGTTPFEDHVSDQVVKATRALGSDLVAASALVAVGGRPIHFGSERRK